MKFVAPKSIGEQTTVLQMNARLDFNIEGGKGRENRDEAHEAVARTVGDGLEWPMPGGKSGSRTRRQEKCLRISIAASADA